MVEMYTKFRTKVVGYDMLGGPGRRFVWGSVIGR
jgi:hypothetical protein